MEAARRARRELGGADRPRPPAVGCSRPEGSAMENTPKVDLRNGVALGDLPDGGIVLGKIESDEVILVRRGDEFFAVGAQCTHYHGPLAEGLIVDATVRDPWHHACFS